MKEKELKKIRRSEFYYGLFIGIWIIVMLALGITLISLWVPDDLNLLEKFEAKPNPPNEIQEIVDACSNLSLFESAECVQENIIPFYYYNISNVGKELNFSELKKQGGVCEHWGETYSFIGKELGFNIENPKIQIGQKNRTIDGKEKEIKIMHTFSIWNDETGYSILDQTHILHFEFEKNKEDEKYRKI